MLVTRLEFVVLVAWIGVWLVIASRASGIRATALRVSVVAAALIAGVSLDLWANHLRFGDWWRTGYPPVTGMFRVSWPQAFEGALGLLLSPGRGVLLFYPLAWLAVPGLGRLIRERQPAGVLCSGLIVVALGLYVCYRVWWAGWSWGPRFLVPLLPLLTLAATFWAFRGWQLGARGRTKLFVGLAALGTGIAWNGILFDFVLYYRWAHKAMSLPNAATTYFQWAASPLVSGWGFLATTSGDLLLLRMGEFAGTPGTVAAVLIASALLACLVWSSRRILHVLREDESAPPG
jgi:hypothetical protein